MAMLEVNDLHVILWHDSQALKGISFEVNQGEVIALIGANGAGKTTTLHTLTGLISAKSGSIKFNGEELSQKLLHTRSWKWVSHMFRKARRVFAESYSVYENLEHGSIYTRKDKAEIPGGVIARVYKSVSLDWKSVKNQRSRYSFRR